MLSWNEVMQNYARFPGQVSLKFSSNHVYFVYPFHCSWIYSFFYLAKKPDSPEQGSEIIIQSEPRRVVRLGVEDVVSQVVLSCTVANQGSFSWKWTKSSNASIINSETKQADLTRTSFLIVHHLSIEDSDDYICRAFYSNQSLSFENTATVVLELENGGLI